MKRIVREITDWRVVGKIVDVESELYDCIRQMKITQIYDDKIILIFVKSCDGNEYFADQSGYFEIEGYSHQVIPEQQITFEQAFAEWVIKPVSMIKHKTATINSSVNWLVDIRHYPHRDDKAEYMFATTRYGLPIFKKEEIIQKAETGEFSLYQSESWEELYEHDLPTLIRMARGE